MTKKVFRPPRVAEYLLRRYSNIMDDRALIYHLDEEFHVLLDQGTPLRAKLWYCRHTICALPSLWCYATSARLSLLVANFKLAWSI